MGIFQHLCLSPDLALDIKPIINYVFPPSTHQLNYLFDVNFGGILLHHDTVQRISQLVRYGLRHQLCTSALSDSSLKVDAACHACHLEDLNSLRPELISLELYLHILLFIKHTLQRLSCAKVCFVDVPVDRLNHETTVGKVCLVDNREVLC